MRQQVGFADNDQRPCLPGLAEAACALAFVVFALHLALRRRALGDVGLALVLVGWPLHAASILTRALEAGHWPLGNMYEYSTGIAFGIVTVCLGLMVRARMRLIGVPAMIVTEALMGVAYMLDEPPGQLVPALHSYWLTIHVTAMATSSGILSFSFFFGLAYLARRWADQRLLATATAPEMTVANNGVAAMTIGGGGGFGILGQTSFADKLRRVLPGAKALDLWSDRFVMIGFPIWSFGVIMGAVWGEHRLGSLQGLGPQGDLSLHHMGGLRHLPPRARDVRLEGEARGDHHRFRVCRHPLHPVCRQPLDRRPPFVCASLIRLLVKVKLHRGPVPGCDITQAPR